MVSKILDMLTGEKEAAKQMAKKASRRNDQVKLKFYQERYRFLGVLIMNVKFLETHQEASLWPSPRIEK